MLQKYICVFIVSTENSFEKKVWIFKKFKESFIPFLNNFVIRKIIRLNSIM